MEPSGLYLIEYTHRHPTVFFPLGRTHFSHVLFFIRARISVSIAPFQFFLPWASFTELGIFSEYSEVTNAFALLDKFPSTILVVGYLKFLVSLSGEYRFGGTPLLALRGKMYVPGVVPEPPSCCSLDSTSPYTALFCSTISTCSIVSGLS
ncbi:hypothetical protein HanRHA438_Chr01g0029661 [Helianthus annuus]|nr:hypothetical protein HanRHA438_Chr01g0029661 [Helianthus annuus]